VGLGKTHLMHAIANYRNENFPKQKIIYLSAEQFMNTFIKAIQQKTIMDFKEQFRSVDVMLIDDFQFLGSKEATQEEFFHTFNTLIEKGKQLVISADKPPASLPGVEARLKSRLGWGLIVDVHPATYELKLSILQNKAQNLNLNNVPQEVFVYIAENVNTSIRELEGAFIRVTKYAEWTKTPITIELAQKMLHNIQGAQKLHNPDSILNYICKIEDITLEEITSASRTRKIARTRQKIIYILRKYTGVSYIQIAKMLGNKDHSSIIYAESQAKKLIRTLPEFAADILNAEKHLNLGEFRKK
jgi:chromosomal replication initiator protein